MRELKFRAWVGSDNTDRVDEEMHYEYGICLENGKYADLSGYGDIYGTYEEVPVEQYTGLKDKNGKEIYEGDIVNKAYHNIVTYDKNGVVEMGYLYDSDGYNNGKIYGWKVGESSLADVCDECEVIGNVHENPELVGGEE